MKPTIKLQHVKNLSSDVDVLVLKEGQFLEAVEYSKKTLVFQFPNVKLKVGILVSLQGIVQAKEENPFLMTGKIIAIEENQEKTLKRVRIDLRQYDKNLWATFLKLSEQEQDRADRLFAAIKGDNR